MYNHAYGLYADTWSAWAELIINISITLVAGYYYGIIGLLMGKIVSTGLIVVFWKPYYLFSKGMKENYFVYWNGAIRNFGVSAVSFLLGHLSLQKLGIPSDSSYLLWTEYCLIGLSVYLAFNLVFTLLFCKGAKSVLARIVSKKH
jgi:hypothetical protein